MSDWWDEDPGKCATCGTTYEWVRPGKSQPICDCDTICPKHGRGAIKYHPPGEVQGCSGYFCAECVEEA